LGGFFVGVFDKNTGVKVSVYTHLRKKDIEMFLELYGSQLIDFQPIKEGVENTNYFITTRNHEKDEQKEMVLTIFEAQSREDIVFFVDVMKFLVSKQLPVPQPVHSLDMESIRVLKDKPCLIQSRLPGRHISPEEITNDLCSKIGVILAKIHVAGDEMSYLQGNKRGLDWIDIQVKRLSPLLPEKQGKYLAERWSEISENLSQKEIPSGLIHGDLFVNNVLINDMKVSGVIDFFQSCRDWFIYDITIAINDWCVNPDTHDLNPLKTKAFIAGYQKVRALKSIEFEVWPVVNQFACLRFWVSRLVTFVYPEEHNDVFKSDNALRKVLDPDFYKDMLAIRSCSVIDLND